MDKPLVSIVIPAYNAAPYVAESIESALRQSYRPIEILAADDGSKDGTADILRRYGPPVKCFFQENRGPAGARNLALRSAKGEYAAFLDADDLWHPEKLSVQVGRLESRSDLGLCAARVKNFRDGESVRWDPPGEAKEYPVPISSTMVRNFFPTSTVVVRMEALNRAGEFDEAIFGSEDWDMWRRICQDWPAVRLDAGLAAYRVREQSVSRNVRRMYVNNRKVLLKTFAANPGMAWHVRARARSYLRLDAAKEWGAERPWPALCELARSALLWPLPMGTRFCMGRLARPRFAAGLLRTLVRARPRKERREA